MQSHQSMLTDISHKKSIPYWLFLEKQQNLKLSSAAKLIIGSDLRVQFTLKQFTEQMFNIRYM